MANVNVTKSINVSAIDAWNELGSFKGIENYSPIASSVVQGMGIGSKRICTMPDGAEISEVLNKLDPDKMHFEYEILSGPFPITNYISDVNIKSLNDENCEISWECNFNVNDEAETDMKNLFEGFYHTIINDLETYIKKN